MGLQPREQARKPSTRPRHQQRRPHRRPHSREQRGRSTRYQTARTRCTDSRGATPASQPTGQQLPRCRSRPGGLTSVTATHKKWSRSHKGPRGTQEKEEAKGQPVRSCYTGNTTHRAAPLRSDVTVTTASQSNLLYPQNSYMLCSLQSRNTDVWKGDTIVLMATSEIRTSASFSNFPTAQQSVFHRVKDKPVRKQQ